MLKRTVFTYCAENKMSKPFSKSQGSAGKDWLYSFLQRHFEISERKSQNLNKVIKLRN